jgi:hypothetical protein
MTDQLVHVRVMGPPEAVEEVARRLGVVLSVAEESADYPRRCDLGARRYLSVVVEPVAATRPTGEGSGRASSDEARPGRESGTIAEIARIVGWVNEITKRRLAGETVLADELVEYQRAKVAVLDAIADRGPSLEASDALAAAQARLAELRVET